jgi:hypothetical protein
VIPVALGEGVAGQLAASPARTTLNPRVYGDRHDIGAPRSALSKCQTWQFLGVLVAKFAAEVWRRDGPPCPPLMSGVPELMILRLVAEREMYGYELARAISAVTKEALSLGEGVLYPAWPESDP